MVSTEAPGYATLGNARGKTGTQLVGVAAQRRGRVSALDFTKGVLVIFMVVYHSINFVHNDPAWTNYLRFVPPSFILITGFLITNVYLARYDFRDFAVCKRLMLRGAKLLLLFIGLNLVANLLLTGTWHGEKFENGSTGLRIGEIFLWGTGKQAFCQVLLPISYLLMLSAGLMAIRHQHYFFHGLLFGFVLMTLLMSGFIHPSINFAMLSMGVWGLALGMVPLTRIDRIARHFYAVMTAYGIYVILSALTQVRDLVQDLGACVALLLLYAGGLRGGDTGLVQRHLILLGKYSLFAYVAQVGFLRLIRGPLREISFPPAGVFAGFAITVTVLMLAVLALDRARSRFAVVDRVYKAVFA